MSEVSDIARNFFENYQKGTDSGDPERMAGLYADVFMFSGPQGAQAVKRDDFLKVIPKRGGFFKAIGLSATSLHSLEETRLDANHIMVKVVWMMRFDKDPQNPILDENSATYILYGQAADWRIVFQLDHQDLMKRAQALGLLPA